MIIPFRVYEKVTNQRRYSKSESSSFCLVKIITVVQYGYELLLFTIKVQRSNAENQMAFDMPRLILTGNSFQVVFLLNSFKYRKKVIKYVNYFLTADSLVLMFGYLNIAIHFKGRKWLIFTGCLCLLGYLFVHFSSLRILNCIMISTRLDMYKNIYFFFVLKTLPVVNVSIKFSDCNNLKTNKTTQYGFIYLFDCFRNTCEGSV